MRRILDKDRLAAFMDAVVAIIMTILVLELERPETISWTALWDMRLSFAAYAVSFFGLAVMWATWHRDWQDITAIDSTTVWAAIAVLFVMSFIPFTTSLVVADFSNTASQTLYGVIAGLLTLMNSLLYRSLARVPSNSAISPAIRSHARLLTWNAVITLAFAGLASITWPPLAAIGILISSLVYVLPVGRSGIASTNGLPASNHPTSVPNSNPKEHHA